MAEHQEDQEHQREALKRVATALKDIGAPFALAGGYAAWARGGPEPERDVAFLVAPEHADEVAGRLAERGFRVVRPPQHGLFEVHTDGATVEVLHRAAGSPDAGPALERATEVEVLSVPMPVLSATDVVMQEFAVLGERYCDLATVVPTARALRDQVDWRLVHASVGDNLHAAVTLDLLGRLHLIGPAGSAAVERR